jgi:hypothetical protein
MFFFGFFKFFNFYENNTNFSLSNRFFYEQLSNNHLFTKNSKVCTQLRKFQKEIKLTVNQELIHILGEKGLITVVGLIII